MPQAVVQRTARRAWGAGRRAAQSVVGDRPRPAPWEASVLDDLADNRPWNLALKGLRVQARVRNRWLREGTTVVIVNWNTEALLRLVVPLVLDTVDETVDVVVVDNASTDGSIAYLRSLGPRVRVRRLPVNAGHAIALDLATLLARTTVVVTLDSDAFPMHDDWLASVVDPVQTGGAVAAGLKATRGFVHPVFMAVDVRAFIRERLSFQVHRTGELAAGEERWGENCFDTAELLSQRVGPARLHFLEPERWDHLGLHGVSAGREVYHHGAMSRQPGGVLTDDAVAGFERAVEALAAGGAGYSRS